MGVMKQFDITYFHGPFAEYVVKPEVIADIALSGMTLMPLHYDTKTNKTALPILRHYGLRAIVSDPRVSAVLRNDDIAGADTAVREVVEDYAGYDNVLGFDITDEPNAAKFPVLGAIVSAFRRYTDKETTINLFPNYASPEQLGNPDYMTHLESFVNTVHPHLLSYDHYHFLGRANRNKAICEVEDERERLIRISAETTENRGGFFENIEDMRRVALKYDIDPMLIVLLTEHGPYRNLTRGELLWEVNMCLCYGMRRISYFTYWEPSHDEHWQWTNAMCDTEGKRMPHWYDVQAINAQISDAGRWLLDKTSEAVFHVGTPEAGARAFEPYGGVTAIDGESAVAGFFRDGSLYLVNRDFLRENTLTVHTDRPLAVRRDGRFVDCGDADCPFTVTLKAGDAILLKL